MSISRVVQEEHEEITVQQQPDSFPSSLPSSTSLSSSRKTISHPHINGGSTRSRPTQEGSPLSAEKEDAPQPYNNNRLEYWINVADRSTLEESDGGNSEVAQTTWLPDILPNSRERPIFQDVPVIEANPAAHSVTAGDSVISGCPQSSVPSMLRRSVGRSFSSRSASKDDMRLEHGFKCSQDDEPDHLTKLTARLASRSGKFQLAEDDHLRFFGPASNLHLFHSGPFSLHQPLIRTVRIHGEAAISRANLQWASDPEYEEHLIDLFFAWDNPVLNAADRTAFMLGKSSYNSGKEPSWYSPTLENSM